MGTSVWAGLDVPKIGPKQGQKLLTNGGAIVLDVRERNELKGGLISDAKWIPYSKIKSKSPKWKSFVKKLDKNKKVLIYCASGGRAGKVATELAEHGFKTANMGGFREWKSEGLPVTNVVPE